VPSKPPPPPPAPPPKSLAPPPSMSSMRAPLPPPTISRVGSSMPSMPEPYPMQQPSGGRGWLTFLALVVLVGAAVVGVLVMRNKAGSLVVTVAGPGGRPVDGVEIYVDGARVKDDKNCPGSPCRVNELKPGTHLVKATAAGYSATADTAVKISAGEEQVHNAQLGRPTEGSGIKVPLEGRGLKLFIDDKEIGPLPQERAETTPGEHKVRIEGERYETFEKTVVVDAEGVTTLEPKLKVKKGLVTIKLGENADGASVTLVSGDERRPIPPDRFKDKALAVDLEAGKAYSIVAEKKGFVPYEKSIDFDDGQAEKTFVVNLMLTSGGSSAEATERHPTGGRPSPGRPAPAPAPAPAAPAPAPAAAGGNATLTFVSDPPSNLVLDGRPLGKTPKTATVPAGNHTVLFIHPDFGRKAKSIPVAAGQKATVKVKFP
ncbi:MAG TPA: carboxypeptidase regulatory-like domain-containing protein, partial [Polyangiaceae bacterium]